MRTRSALTLAAVTLAALPLAACKSETLKAPAVHVYATVVAATVDPNIGGYLETVNVTASSAYYHDSREFPVTVTPADRSLARTFSLFLPKDGSQSVNVTVHTATKTAVSVRVG